MSRVNHTASIYFAAMAQPSVDLHARRLDPVAVNAALRRLARAPQAPWLHAEVARRMADKLQVIVLKPERLIDWWSALGAGAELLAQAYPQALRVAVEPDAAWAQRGRELNQKPWWSLRRWAGGGAEVVEQRRHPGRRTARLGQHDAACGGRSAGVDCALA